MMNEIPPQSTEIWRAAACVNGPTDGQRDDPKT